MSTTIVPNYAKRGLDKKFDIPDLREKMQEHLQVAQTLFESIHGDEDKAGEMDDANYYEGCGWGVEFHLQFLTGIKLEFDNVTGEEVVLAKDLFA